MTASYLLVDVSSRFQQTLRELREQHSRVERIQYADASGVCYACVGAIRGSAIGATIERRGARERYMLHSTCPG